MVAKYEKYFQRSDKIAGSQIKIGLIPDAGDLGDFTETLKEFCRFIPELEFDPIEE